MRTDALCALRLCLRAPLGLAKLAVGRTRSLPRPTRPSLARLTCAHAHWYLCRVLPLSLERPTEGTHPQQVHRAASSGFPTSLLLLSFEGLVAWGKCGEEQSHKDTLFRAILFQ